MGHTEEITGRPGRFWEPDSPGHIRCTLCPRACVLGEGQRGFCFVRRNVGGAMQLTTYGYSSGFCVDPVEKKPLNHFYPGSGILSFGTAGCNLGCRFCQNWDISKARAFDRLTEEAAPEAIAAAAKNLSCMGVAFTYNDPVIFAEYAIDTARACHEMGLKTVAVTAGYISPGAREEFFAVMDAANIDLKGFTEDFYHRLCAGHLQPVLDTLVYVREHTSVWLEITTLLIPGANDSEEEVRALSRWVRQNLGPDVPVHFTAFHPDFRLRDRPATPPDTLKRARAVARAEGLHYVYTGNVHDLEGDTTFCPACGAPLIERDWYEIRGYHLTNTHHCAACGAVCAGHFGPAPGTWGARRRPVVLP